MRENDWTKVLGWPGYKVYRAEIDEQGKRLKLWVRRKRGSKQLICSGCGQLVSAIAETCESAAARRVARQFGLSTGTVVAINLRYLERWSQSRKKPALRNMGVDE